MFPTQLSYLYSNIIIIFCVGVQNPAGSLAVIPQRYAPLRPDSIPSPDVVCAFSFQSSFCRFSRFSIFPPAS